MDQRVIDMKLQLLRDLAVATRVPIAGWEARTAEYAAEDDYRFTSDWAPVALPARFPAGITVFLRAQADVPAEAPPAYTYLQFDIDALEALLRLDGLPYAGVDAQHRRIPARAGRLVLELEGMVQPAVYYRPELAGTTGGLTHAAVVTIDPDIQALVDTVAFAADTAKAIDDPRRKALLGDAVEAALLAVDLTVPRSRLSADARQALARLQAQLVTIHPDPEGGALYAVGHTHIDTAWLWPLHETVRKCARTFSTACRLMERFPEFHFTCSQPQLYQYAKTHFPDLYREIQRWVAAGRWETAGAMWVEADCNVTGGESLVRQMLYGLSFFREEFGTRPRMCWLPDVFGYPASLPDILAACGVTRFYTYKLHWQAATPFPDHLFHWRGLSGVSILAHVVNHAGAYNNDLCPDHLYRGWQLYAQKAAYPEVIFPFGYGDGGGGVTEGQLRRLRLASGQFPGLPAVDHGTAEDFFDLVEAADPALPTWDGELYVETHRGTYTTHSDMKRGNRRCERLLRDAEICASLAALRGVRPFDASVLRPAWQQVLTRQFHDILPGSSIGMVYTEALALLATVQAEAQALLDDRLAALAGPTAADAVAVLNTCGWDRTELCRVDIADRPVRSVLAPDGTRRPAQVVARADGRATVLFPVDAPACGLTHATLSADPALADDALTVSTAVLENRFFRVELTPEGGLARVYDKRAAREVLAPGAIGNDLQLFQDGPEGEDAWNVHETATKHRYPFEGTTTLAVTETGPLRAVVRVTRTHRASTLEQEIILYAEMPRLDFRTRIDWQERQTLLKVAFPVDIRATSATYEVQFGAYARATHRNTSWEQTKFEVPGQRWVDLSEAGYGVSLLNDGRYGYDTHDNVVRLTLLRGTIFPDPEADRGTHEVTYSLYPHAGGWTEAETVRRAWELNTPLYATPGATPAPTRFLRIDGSAILETLKPAEDGNGWIVRLYEPHGARGPVTVRSAMPLHAVTMCNAVEEGAEALPHDATAFTFLIRPFEIRTFRLIL